MSEKIDFNTKTYIMSKGSIKNGNYKYIYTPHISAPRHIRQILTNIKGEIDSNTIIVGGFNIPL